MAGKFFNRDRSCAPCASPRYLFPVSGKPLRDATITLAGPRIAALGDHCPGVPVRDLGNVAVLPGLVNAHTHLEFSDLAAPLGSPGESLPAWIRRVIAHRRTRAPGQPGGVSQGLMESTRNGTTAIGEIATGPWPIAAEPKALVAVFRELIGLLPEQIGPQLAAAKVHLDEPWASHPDLRGGLSPHAPYSVHPDLVRGLVKLAGQSSAPLAMHLAESQEELELLAAGTGSFRELLDELQVWSPGAIPRDMRVLDYLRELTAAPRALVIHGNYLAPDEIDFLAAHYDRLSVVYCPRTHAWFGHERYPLAQMLSAGVRVALGTDSRASNPDLSLLEELRFVARHHPQVEPAAVLGLGTLAGARALGVDRDVGTLAAGKLANLTVVPLPEREAGDPHELLFDSSLPACQTWFRGRQL